MKYTQPQKIFLCVLGVLTLGVVFTVSPFLNSYIHGAVNIFAGGRSSAKVYGFLIYTLVLLSIALLRPNISIIKDERTAKKLLLGGIGLLFMIGFGGLIYFLNRYGFTLTDFIVTFNNNEISSTSLSHNHIGKGMIGHILQVFGYTHFETIDAGHAFIGLLPGWFYAVFGIVLALVAFLTIGIFAKEASTKHPRLLYIFLYATLSFGVIEHTFDGGFADPRVAMMFVLFSLLLLGATRRRVFGIITIGVLSFVMSFVYLKTNALSGEDSYLRMIFSLVAYGGFFYIPLILLFKRVSPQLQHLLCFLSILFIVPFFLNMADANSYKSVSMKADDAYVALYPHDISAPFPVADTLNDLTIYAIPAGTFSTINDVLSKYDLVDNMVPINVEWQTCFPHGQSTLYVLTITSKTPLIEGESATALSTTTVHSGPQTAQGFYTYKAKILLKPCVPRQVNVIEEIIKQRGTKEFFISSITAANYTPNAK